MTTTTTAPTTIEHDDAVAAITVELDRVRDEERSLQRRRRELPEEIARLRNSPTGLESADEILALERELAELPTRFNTVRQVREEIDKRRSVALKRAARAMAEQTAPERKEVRRRFWIAFDALRAAADEVGEADAELSQGTKAAHGRYSGESASPWRVEVGRALNALQRVAGPRPSKEDD